MKGASAHFLNKRKLKICKNNKIWLGRKGPLAERATQAGRAAAGGGERAGITALLHRPVSLKIIMKPISNGCGYESGGQWMWTSGRNGSRRYKIWQWPLSAANQKILAMRIIGGVMAWPAQYWPEIIFNCQLMWKTTQLSSGWRGWLNAGCVWWKLKTAISGEKRQPDGGGVAISTENIREGQEEAAGRKPAERHFSNQRGWPKLASEKWKWAIICLGRWRRRKETKAMRKEEWLMAKVRLSEAMQCEPQPLWRNQWSSVNIQWL